MQMSFSITETRTIYFLMLAAENRKGISPSPLLAGTELRHLGVSCRKQLHGRDACALLGAIVPLVMDRLCLLFTPALSFMPCCYLCFFDE